VAPPANALTPGMRRIMELLGETIGEISEDERGEINQQLHDLILLEPAYFSITDLPIRRDLLTRDNLRVFQSANKYKRAIREQQRQAQREAREKEGKPNQSTLAGSRPKEKPPSARQGAAGPPSEGRPTRSNTKAEDIPPTPSVPLERKPRKDQNK